MYVLDKAGHSQRTDYAAEARDERGAGGPEERGRNRVQPLLEDHQEGPIRHQTDTSQVQ